MKNNFSGLKYTLIGLFTLLMTLNSFAQTGIECVWCSGMNGHHNPGCQYLASSKPSVSSIPNQQHIEQEIMIGIFKVLLSPPKQNNKELTSLEKEKQALENKNKELKLKEEMAKLKLFNDSVAQARHDKMMKEYKPLEGSGGLTLKGLDDSKNKKLSHFNCKITSFNGNVTVVKSDGKMIKLTMNTTVNLSSGDWVATGFNSSIKLHYSFETGGEDVLLGQKSALTIMTNDEGNYIPKLVKGKLYVTNNKVSEKMAEAKEEIASEAEKLEKQLLRKFKYEVRTPTAICGIRGTEFSLNVDSTGATVVVVKNGVVDIYGTNIESTFTLTSGYKGMVTSAGEVIGPVKFEESEIEKWWETE